MKFKFPYVYSNVHEIGAIPVERGEFGSIGGFPVLNGIVCSSCDVVIERVLSAFVEKHANSPIRTSIGNAFLFIIVVIIGLYKFNLLFFNFMN